MNNEYPIPMWNDSVVFSVVHFLTSAKLFNLYVICKKLKINSNYIAVQTYLFLILLFLSDGVLLDVLSIPDVIGQVKMNIIKTFIFDEITELFYTIIAKLQLYFIFFTYIFCDSFKMFKFAHDFNYHHLR